jgi:hypothetical protein
MVITKPHTTNPLKPHCHRGFVLVIVCQNCTRSGNAREPGKGGPGFGGAVRGTKGAESLAYPASALSTVSEGASDADPGWGSMAPNKGRLANTNIT